MKKALRTLIIVFIASHSLYAQVPSFGLRLGANFPTMTNIVETGQSRIFAPSLSFGLLGRMRFDELYFIAEFNYEQKGYAVKLGKGDQSYERMRNNYFEVPLLFRFNPYSSVGMDIYTECGIYGAYWLSSTLETNDSTGGHGDYVKTVKDVEITRSDSKQLYGLYDGGLVVGAGVTRYTGGGAGEAYVGVRMTYGLVEAMRYTGSLPSVRIDGSNNFVLNVSIGYYFNNFDKAKHINFHHGPYY